MILRTGMHHSFWNRWRPGVRENKPEETGALADGRVMMGKYPEKWVGRYDG